MGQQSQWKVNTHMQMLGLLCKVLSEFSKPTPFKNIPHFYIKKTKTQFSMIYKLFSHKDKDFGYWHFSP